jgi:hypothetical protein
MMEYFPRTLLTRDQAGEWKEYKVIEFIFMFTPDDAGTLVLTIYNDARRVVATTPITEEIKSHFGYSLWPSCDGPMSHSYWCTYELTPEGIRPTAVYDAGSFYPLS